MVSKFDPRKFKGQPLILFFYKEDIMTIDLIKEENLLLLVVWSKGLNRSRRLESGSLC